MLKMDTFIPSFILSNWFVLVSVKVALELIQGQLYTPDKMMVHYMTIDEIALSTTTLWYSRYSQLVSHSLNVDNLILIYCLPI